MSTFTNGLMTFANNMKSKIQSQPQNETIQDIQKKREQSLLDQYQAARTGLTAAKDEARRQSRTSLDRFANVSGLSGGAAEKAKQEASRNLETGFAQNEAALNSSEAAAKDNMMAQYQQALQQQESLQFQKDSFAQQMKFAWSEFDENLKTNLVNSAIALKNSGLGSRGSWEELQKTLGGIYGSGRAASSSGSDINISQGQTMAPWDKAGL